MYAQLPEVGTEYEQMGKFSCIKRFFVNIDFTINQVVIYKSCVNLGDEKF